MNYDKELIENTIRGDLKAFEELFNVHYKKTYGFLYSILHDENASLDILQETFINVYKNIHKFDKNKNFTTWLYTIAKNNAFNYIKVIKTNEAFDENIDLMASAYYLKPKSPENIYLEKQSKIKLINSIDKLPYKYKTLIYLKYIENLSQKEISCSLKISEALVESRLYAARKKLYKILKESEKNE